MKVNEIKKTETIEKVIRTEYIAVDGTVFHDKGECEKYERTALCEVSNRLKRLLRCTQYDINDSLSDECDVEVFDIQTETDLSNLKMYLHLICPELVDRIYSSSSYGLKDVTLGHEVMIFWGYDHACFWVYGDGSVRAYGEFFVNGINKMIANEKEKSNEQN